MVAYQVGTEAVGYYYIYKHEDYQDLNDKIRNLGKRLKKLKYDYLYVPSNKKKAEQKMIKVQEDNYKEYHRELNNLKYRFNMGSGLLQMVLGYFLNNYYWGRAACHLPF